MRHIHEYMIFPLLCTTFKKKIPKTIDLHNLSPIFHSHNSLKTKKHKSILGQTLKALGTCSYLEFRAPGEFQLSYELQERLK